MNICFISSEYPPEMPCGGIGTYTYEVSKKLADLGHVVVVICKTKQKEYEIHNGNLHIYRINDIKLLRKHSSSFARGIRIYRKVLEFNNLYKFDIIEAPEFLGEAWLITKKLKNVVIRLHCPSFITCKINKQEKGFKNFIRNKIEQYLEIITLKNAKFITAPSESIIKEVKNMINIVDGVVIPNPINIDKFTNEKNEKDINGKIKLLFVGKMSYGKGADTLIKAINLIYEKGYIDKFNINIIGPNTMFNGVSFLEEIKKDVQPEMFKYINLLGSIPREEIKNHYLNSDVVIMPSVYENFPYVMLEAMLYENLIICSNIGGMTEIISNTSGNYLVGVGKYVDIYESIIELINKKDVIKVVGIENRKNIIKLYNVDEIVNNLLNFYSNITHNRMNNSNNLK